MLNVKRTLSLVVIIAAFMVGCDDSASTNGSGSVYGDLATLGSAQGTFGNLYKSYVSKSSVYVEVKFQGQLGEDSATSNNNWVVLPVWYKDSNHYYACILTEADLGGLDPEIAAMALINDGSNQDVYYGNPPSTNLHVDVFALTDLSEKTFGCELIDEGGSVKINAYLNGVKYHTYVVGSNSNHDGTVDAADPGISSSSLNGRAGFGIGQYWSDVKVNSFVMYDKRPL